MKVTNLRRKLAASLVAGGLFVPVASAADLNTNLVENPGFEIVGTVAGNGAYLDDPNSSWMDGSGTNYAYAHATGYANGTLANPGLYFFNSNFASPDGDVLGPGVVAQNLDVSTGDSAATIASGEAAFNMSGYFSSFGTQGDVGVMEIEFRDGGGSPIGPSVVLSDSDTTDWTLEQTSGLIPTGTESLYLSLYGIIASGGPDGYIDNVDVQVSSAEDSLVFLEVNTTTGQASIRNETGESVFIDYYEIFSDDGNGSSLQPDNGDWMSLEDQDLAGFPAGDGSGNGWEEAGGSDSGVLSESYLTGNSELTDEAMLPLGEIFNTAEDQDLVFRYGSVTRSSAPTADYNNDGTVNIADYTVWRDSLGATVTPGEGADGDGSGTIDAGDYDEWKSQFGQTGGPSGPGVLTTGFVRYVTSGSIESVNVPEPGSVTVICLAVSGLIVGSQLRRRND